MQKESSQNYIIYAVLLLLFLIRFLPFLYPESRIWGFNHLIFISDRFVLIFALLSALALVLPLSGFSTRMGESLADCFNRVFYDSKRYLIYRLLFIILTAALFAIFAASTHFLGDGYAAISNLSDDSIKIHKWSELGFIYMVSAIRAFLGETNSQTARMAYQVLSVFSGIITFWFFFLIAGNFRSNRYKTIIVFTCLVISGTILLFFGYVESYPILWVAMAGYIYYAMRFLDKQTGLLWAVVFLIFGILLHLQMLIFVPSCLYLIYHQDNLHKIYDRYRILILSLLAAIAAVLFSLFIYKYSTDLYFRDIFLPLLNGKDATPDYPLLGINHMVDIINLLLLLSPALPILIILSIGGVKANDTINKIVFWGIISTCSLLFLFVIDPMLGMPRDWDLFSFSALGLTMLFIYRIPDNKNLIVFRFLPSFIMFLAIGVIPYLMTNLNEQNSISYSKYLINLDKERSRSAILTLRDYYKNQGDEKAVDSINARLEICFPDDRRIFMAFEALKRNEFNRAQILFDSLTPNEYSSEYHNLKGMIALVQGRLNESLEELNKAVQIRKYDPRLLFNLAMVHSGRGETEPTLSALRKGYDLQNNNVDILEGLAYMYDLQNKPDSVIYYARKLVDNDSEFVDSYYLIARSFFNMNRPDSANKYYKIYKIRGFGDKYYDTRINELKQYIKQNE